MMDVIFKVNETDNLLPKCDGDVDCCVEIINRLYKCRKVILPRTTYKINHDGKCYVYENKYYLEKIANKVHNSNQLYKIKNTPFTIIFDEKDPWQLRIIDNKNTERLFAKWVGINCNIGDTYHTFSVKMSKNYDTVLEIFSIFGSILFKHLILR